MNNSDKPASPIFNQHGVYAEMKAGLNKREHFAGLAMQGMIAHYSSAELSRDAIAAVAVEFADSLLKQLDS